MRAGTAGLIGVAAAGLALGACHPAKLGERRNEKSLLVSSRLMCPDRQGELTRADAAGDGRSCRYAGEDGSEVTLQLASLDGRTPQLALADMEAKLKSELPAPSAKPAADTSPSASASANAVATTDKTGADEDDEDGGHTRINLPFLHIETKGERAQVNMPGVHVNADGENADVQVNKFGGKLVSIHSDDKGAEIRMGDISPKNVDATYILASKGADGEPERSVGYVAKGPVGGPLVVALVKSPTDRHDSNDLFRAVKRLVARNVKRG